MKNRDVANLLNRAAAAIETPLDFTNGTIQRLLKDLNIATISRDKFVSLYNRAILTIKNLDKINEGDKRSLLQELTSIAKSIASSNDDIISVEDGRTLQKVLNTLNTTNPEDRFAYESAIEDVLDLVDQYRFEHLNLEVGKTYRGASIESKYFRTIVDKVAVPNFHYSNPEIVTNGFIYRDNCGGLYTLTGVCIPQAGSELYHGVLPMKNLTTEVKKEATRKNLNIEVGKVFRTREGEVSQITSKITENDKQIYQLGYRFVGGPCGQYYTEQGLTYTDGTLNPGDLVEEIEM